LFKKQNIINLFFLGLFYHYIFAPKLNTPIPINTGIVSSVVIILLCIRRKIPSNVVYLCLCFIGLGIYSEILSLTINSNSSSYLKLVSKTSLYFIVGFYFFSFINRLSNCTKNAFLLLLKLFSLSVFINSTIIMIEFFVPSFKDFLQNIVLYQDHGLGGINYSTHLYRLRGYSSGGAATLSVTTTVGILSAIYLYKANIYSSKFCILLVLLCYLSLFFLARTGLLFSTVILVFYFIVMLRKSFSSITNLFLTIILVSLVVSCFLLFYNILYTKYTYVLDWAMKWDGERGAGNSFSKLINSFSLTNNYFILLFGTGYYYNSSFNSIPTDSGYLKLIYNIGLPLSFLFYSLFLYLLSNALKARIFPSFFIIIFVILFIFEIKEPCFIQNHTIRFVFVILPVMFYKNNYKLIK